MIGSGKCIFGFKCGDIFGVSMLVLGGVYGGNMNIQNGDTTQEHLGVV